MEHGYPILRLLRPVSGYLLSSYLLVGGIGSAAFVWTAIIATNQSAVRSYWFYAGALCWMMFLMIFGFVVLAVVIEARQQELADGFAEDTGAWIGKQSPAATNILQHRIAQLEGQLTTMEQREASRH